MKIYPVQPIPSIYQDKSWYFDVNSTRYTRHIQLFCTTKNSSIFAIITFQNSRIVRLKLENGRLVDAIKISDRIEVDFDGLTYTCLFKKKLINKR
jgi:hypothetical protein